MTAAYWYWNQTNNVQTSHFLPGFQRLRKVGKLLGENAVLFVAMQWSVFAGHSCLVKDGLCDWAGEVLRQP